MLLAFIAFEHFLRRERLGVQFIGGQDETTLLYPQLLMGSQHRSQRAVNMVIDSVWQRPRTRTAPVAIARRSVDGHLGDARTLQAALEGLQGLLGICFTGKHGAAQMLKGFGFALTAREPLLVDCTLRRGTAMCGVEQDPTLLDPAIARGPHSIAIPCR